MIRLKQIFVILLNLIALISVKTTEAQLLSASAKIFDWKMLTPIPDSIGFAGSFAGVADDVLIVAGGSNFPNGGTPWNGGTKKWYDKIFVLENPNGEWKEAGVLPFPLGYGVSISTEQGLILIGGSNEKGHVAYVLCLRYKEGKVVVDHLPSLPFTIANVCGALVGDKIFIAGGIITPSSTVTENKFICLDLDKRNASWEQLPSWPGPSRMLAVAGAYKDRFYLFSGAELKDGKRIYLKDAYVFCAKNGWKKLSDLPFPVVAAPSPALNHNGNLMIFGGDNGKDAAEAATLREQHPGFSNKIISYNVDENNWHVADTIKTNKKDDIVSNPNNSIWAPVTTTLAVWKNKIVLPGGEVRPGTRTPNVLIAEVKRN